MSAAPRPRHVWLDGRRFVVRFDSKGEPRAIYERKIYQPGTPMEAFYDAPYWNSAHRKAQDPDAMVSRILRALKEPAR